MTSVSLPLLEASGLRVAVDGSMALDGITLTTSGSRLSLVGDAGALVSLLGNVPLGAATLAQNEVPDVTSPEGIATVASGSLVLLGADVARGDHLGLVGFAPRDPPLPLDLTALEYLTWSARLAGLGGLSKSRAEDALRQVGLAKNPKRALRAFALPERRAATLAHAMVASPAVLLAEDPLTGLEGEALSFVLAALHAAIEGRATVVSFQRALADTAQGRFALGSSDLAIVSRGELLSFGSPRSIAERATLYGLTVRSNAEAFTAELSARGIALRGGPQRFSAELPEGKDTRDILAAASAARAGVVELLPLM